MKGNNSIVVARVSLPFLASRGRIMKNVTNLNNTLRCITFLAAAVIVLTTADLHARHEPAQRLIAIVIAVSNTQSDVPEITRLPYTLNDAECVLQALRKWSFADCRIHKLIEDGGREATQPTKANIESRLPEWLRDCSATDTVIVFLSGHGISRDEDGQFNAIVPSDVDGKNLQDSVVQVRWLREQLGCCKAQTKFLFLDCCHAGGEGGLSEQSEGVVKSAAPSHEALDVVTIASCGAGEKSHYWKDLNLSIFSFWLGEALRGNADTNGDREISSDELYKYVYENVRKTASDLGFVQNPVRILRSGVQGDPIVMKTSQNVKSLDDFLDDVARQISATMQQKEISNTGTLEFFALSTGGTEILGRSEFGLLSSRCAEKLNGRLLANLPKGYDVIKRQMIESTLRSKNITIDDVFSGKMSEAVGTVKFIGAESIKSFIVGKITKTDKEDIVDISCELTGLPNITVLKNFSGRVCLSQIEIAEKSSLMQAPKLTNQEPGKKIAAVAQASDGVLPDYRSAISVPEPIGARDVAQPVTSETPTLVPLSENDVRMFRVRFEVKRSGQFHQLQPVFRDGKTYIPLELGDVYRIRIHNPLSEYVMVRVLVDGLNTLPEKIVVPEKVKFAAVASDDLMQYVESLKAAGAMIVQDGNSFYQVAAPMGLDNARPWQFAPGTEALISGFFCEVGASGKYNEFQVTDASFSIGGQTNFTGQLGIITIGFFKAVPSEPVVPATNARSVGTRMGYKYRLPVMVDFSMIPGGILETQQFFYAPSSGLQ